MDLFGHYSLVHLLVLLLELLLKEVDQWAGLLTLQLV